jgi:RHS repeat-associated protein
MTTTNYIWDEQNYLAETDQNNVVQTVYTNEPKQYGNLVSSRISGTASYHHFDAIGSTRQLTNSAGTVTDTVIYDAWGNVVSRSGITVIAFLWTGEIEYYLDPETGLYHVRERAYGPVIGRWTAIDPLQFDGGVLNHSYIYSNNSPALHIDPTGLMSWKTTNYKIALCGAYDWTIAFEPDKATESPGWIIQKVTFDYSAYNCNRPRRLQRTSSLCPPFGKPTESYWELWYTKLGKVYDRGTLRTKMVGSKPTLVVDQASLVEGPEDTFAWTGMQQDSTTFQKGCAGLVQPWAEIGEVSFRSGNSIIKGTWVAGGVKSAGGLASTCTEPPGWPYAPKLKRWIYRSWCCCDRKEKGDTTIGATPGLPDDTL